MRKDKYYYIEKAKFYLGLFASALLFDLMLFLMFIFA